MVATVEMLLSYSGESAENHQLDFYDAAIAMVGFQRSLAVTTHLVLNGEVITQSPSLKNATIYADAPRAGSWEVPVTIAMGLGAAWKLGTAPKDSVIGHLVRSAYDYIVSSITGVHVDFDKTIGAQLDDERSKGNVVPDLRPSQLDSASEKCYIPVRDLHRPIAFSKSATSAIIVARDYEGADVIGPTLTEQTYQAVIKSLHPEGTVQLRGRVSSYNVNTFRGRIYIESMFRPIPFEIDRHSRNPLVVRVVASSLARNARNREDPQALIEILASPTEARSGALKSLRVYQAREVAD